MGSGESECKGWASIVSDLNLQKRVQDLTDYGSSQFPLTINFALAGRLLLVVQFSVSFSVWMHNYPSNLVTHLHNQNIQAAMLF